jgi:hypothetical protein
MFPIWEEQPRGIEIRLLPCDRLDDEPDMIRRFLFAALCVFGPLSCFAHGGNINGEANYISFSVPGALGTYPMGINASMQVAGYYYVSSTAVRGFLREADGTITTFDVAGSTWTQPEAINAAGDITGFYEKSVPQGFLRYADGRTITFEADQTFPFDGVLPVSINDFDVITGNYFLSAGNWPPFTRSGGGVSSTPAAPILATAINASGSVVGYSYQNSAVEFTAGFVVHPDGYSAEIVVPGNDATRGCANQNIPDAINAAGTVAGWYTHNYYNSSLCQPTNTGGFVMSPDGKVTLFQPPGTMPEWFEHLPPFETGEPHKISIDQAGDVTGSSHDGAGVAHAFVRNPYGTITQFDPPEGSNSFPTGINDGGVIAGYYSYRTGGPPVGFIRVP